MSDEPKNRGGSVSRFGSGSPGDSGQGGIFEPGSLISYTYEVEALLARGGMGEVYRTRHTEIGTEHAIKIVRPDLANNEKIMELFRREASVLRTVRDDSIVGYDGVLRDEEGRVYLVMEYVDGPSLTQFLEDRVLTLEEVRGLRDRLARGLAAAHDKGVIHRDMSPDNIILNHGDLEQAKIIDFGIAKLADSSATTIIGDDFAGRYAYASPEQIGLYGGQVDARSDIYSLGLVLATAATGKALNMGEINESLVSVIEARKRVPDFSSVPEELRPELGSMLEPDPADRPQTMRDVIGLDEKLRQEEAEAAREAKPAAAAPAEERTPLAAEPAARPAAEAGGQRRWMMPALAAGIAVVAAGGYFVWQQNEEAPVQPIAESGAAPDTQAVAAAPAAAGNLASNEVAPASGPAPAEEEPEDAAQADEAAKAAEETRQAAEAKAVEEQVAALPEPTEAERQLERLKAADAALSAEERQEIQRDLKALGHYPGAVDGSFGPGTRAGIESYQRVAGVEPTGFLLPETREALAKAAAPVRAEEARRLAAEKAEAEKAASQAASLKAAAERAAAAQAGAQARDASQASASAPAPDSTQTGITQQAIRPNETDLERVMRLAAGGDMLAQASLGQRYYRGRGVSRDLNEAARWTRLAAEQGEPRAQSNLGFYYMNGEGVGRDPLEAARWWRAAADQGLAQAQFNLGLLYENGEGVPRDYAEAAKWYGLAADQGDRNAADRLKGLKQRDLVPAE